MSVWYVLARREPRSRPARRVALELTLPDALVALTLLGWLLLGPTLFDDGWIAAIERNSVHSGAYSSYFDNYAANAPSGTWLKWVQHLVVGHTSNLLVQRLPSIAALAALWVVCRITIATRAGAPSNRDGRWWTAAAVFSLSAAAFGVTLRPEPFCALLVGGVLLGVLRFASTSRASSLFVAVILSGLAVTAHPIGIVALAPLIAGLPLVLRRRRQVGYATLATLAVAGVAWTVLLQFLNTDLHRQLVDARLFRNGGTHGGSVLNEVDRYRALATYAAVGSTGLRREAVLMGLLCVGSLIVLRTRSEGSYPRLPAASLALAFALLAFVPSKWVHHFGVLIAPMTVAAASEISLGAKEMRRLKRMVFPITIIALLLFAVAGYRAAKTPAELGPLDLRTVSPKHLSDAALGYVLVPAGAILLLLGRRLRQGRRDNETVAQVRDVLPWVVPLAIVVQLMLTAGAYAADAARTPGWTVLRQNVDLLRGTASCGLAAELRVPDWRSIRRLAPLLDRRWYVLASTRAPGHLGVFVRDSQIGTPRLAVFWGRQDRGAVTQLGSAAVSPAGRQPASYGTVTLMARLPNPPRGANVMRFVVHGAQRNADRLEPFTYTDTSLEALLKRSGESPLVSPFLSEAMPCAGLPRLARGAAAQPRLLVDIAASPTMTNPHGPFGSLPDLFQLWRIPLAGKARVPYGLSAYIVAPHPGDIVVPARELRS